MSTSYGVTVQAMHTADTEAELRKRIKAILKFGVTKRALAEVMDVQESWLGRWLAGADADVQVRPINVPEMDRFERWRCEFVKQLQAEPKETQRAASAATTSTAGEDFRADDKRRRRHMR